MVSIRHFRRPRFLLIFLILSLIYCCTASDVKNEPAAITIEVDAGELGKIRGYPGWTFTGRKFWMFHGVPYAEAPVFRDRFKPSILRNRTLTPGGVFDASNALNMCPQNNLIGFMENSSEGQDPLNVLNVLKAERRMRMALRSRLQGEEMSTSVWGIEDCLVLNIHTKNIHQDQVDPADPLVPVLFYIHGGSSDSAWGGVFGGLRLLDEPIVVVSINYRLGILGSFNLGVNDAPGNAAMYDSVTALRWVKKYIHHFGGDPDRVIISGHSAGSMMVTHLLLSPMAAGLFHGVIGASGSSLASWATATHPSIHHHLHVAKYAACYDGPTDLEDIDLEKIDLAEVVKCMQERPVAVLIRAVDDHSREQQFLGLGMGYDDKVPSIQSPDLTNMEIFLAKSAHDIVAAGEQANVPLMMGTMRHDGTMALEKTYYDYLVPNKLLDDEEFMRNDLIPKLSNLMGVEDRTEALYHSLAQTYMGDDKNSGNFSIMLAGLIDIHSVFAFKAGSYLLVKKHSKVNPNSYYFSFDYDGLFTVYDPSSDIPGGVAHVEDLLYLFFGGIMIIPADFAVSNRYVKYWINFMYHGNPNTPGQTDEWLPYSPVNHPYRSINKVDATKYWTRDSWRGPGYEIVDKDEHITTAAPTSPVPIQTEPENSSKPTTNVETTTMPGSSSMIKMNFDILIFAFTWLCAQIFLH